MKKNEGISAQIKIDAINFYEKIWSIVSDAKKKMKKKMLRRKDFQHVITLDDPDLLSNMMAWKAQE